MERDQQVRDDEVSVLKEQMRQLIHHFSHDLRNPLVNIHALLNEMKSMLAESEAGRPALLNREMPETVKLFEQTVDRMSEMINGTNDIYHCMFDNLEYEMVNIQELAERVLKRFQGRLTNIDISMTDLSDIWADPLALARIVEHLVENAVESMTSTGGKLLLRVEGGDDFSTLIVSNSGSEIYPDDLDQIFLPFYSTKNDASGMGLAVVKALTESHGGRAWCESEPGDDTIFYAAFPAVPVKVL